MMANLIKKLDEIRRLQTLYYEHRDSDQEWARRKAHLDLDRFLMENRETAIICMEQVLERELQELRRARKAKPKFTFRKWLSSMHKPMDL